MDDVVNVSGHRLSTAEIEAALIEHRKFQTGVEFSKPYADVETQMLLQKQRLWASLMS